MLMVKLLVHSEKLHGWYCLPVKCGYMRRPGLTGRVNTRALVTRHDGKIPLIVPMHGLEDNIKIDLGELCCECLD